MAHVHKLPDDLANQIAAGEVVERPASVVKELVENALDAGASRVVVDTEDGGTRLIRVSDDGSGMTRDDAILCLERHATSKLSNVTDLFALHTFGFRGEALPSIASVSRLTLRTRTRDCDEAVEITIEGGGKPVIRPASAAVGTTLEVRDLFFNVPARRKFLKATATESAHITETIASMALAKHDVTLAVHRDGRLAREYLRMPSRAERARTLLGLEGTHLLECHGQRGNLQITAMLGPPERARTGATSLTLLVNGRPVRDRPLARAVAQAYGSVLEAGRYPVGVVWIDLPPDLVDVNVHPQKAEVRFANARAVFEALTRELRTAIGHGFGLGPAPVSHEIRHDVGDSAIDNHGPDASNRASLQTSSLAPSVEASPTFVWREPPLAAGEPAGESAGELSNASIPDAAFPQRLGDSKNLSSFAVSSGSTTTKSPASTPAKAQLLPERNLFSSLADSRSEAFAPPNRAWAPSFSPDASANRPNSRAGHEPVTKGQRFSDLRYVGQVRATYLVCEGDDGLYILDQHAAAERVTFARMHNAYKQKQARSQRLLVAEIVDLGARDVGIVEENAGEIAELGIEARAVGDSAIAVHAVPALLAHANPAQILKDVVAELERSATRPFSSAVDRIIATMACHGSVRAGDVLTSEEACALLRSLDDVEFAGHCPHGRPVLLKVPFGDLERSVGR